jgi:hypothetical protein
MISVHYLGSACVELLSRECLCVGAVCGEETKLGQLFARAPLSTRDILKEALRLFLPTSHHEHSMNSVLHHQKLTSN